MTDTAYASIDQLRVMPELDAMSDARAQQLLNQIAIQVDAALTAAGYTAPATGDNDILLIGQFVVNMAAAQAWRELYHDQDEPDRIGAWERGFNAFLKGIATGVFRLTDQSTAEAGGLTAGKLTWRRHPDTSEWG